MNWNHQKVLVTGAGGFIGSHLAERLVEIGARTTALVRYNSAGSWGWLDESPRRGDLEVVAGDVTDRDQMEAVVRGHDVVFHLAALIAIPYSYQAPRSYVETNIGGTLNVLQASLSAGVRTVVQTSTSEVYGSPTELPIRETHPLQGQSPYAATKIGADMLALSFERSFGLPVRVLRPFNTFGPRQSARAVIPTIVAQALTSNVVKLGHVTPTRDFTFVTDTADAFVRMAELEASPDGVVQIGSGREISIGDLAARIIEMVGRPVSLVADSSRERPDRSEVDRLCADTSKAAALLGWSPKTTLADGLRRTIDSIAGNPQRYRPAVYGI
jgi:NAD dependent epimerase/dehydratase